MKKLLLLTITGVVLGAGLVGAQTESYHISVTIPAIVGFNVPDPRTAAAFETTNTPLEKIFEPGIRNNEPIILETIVPR